MLDKTGGVALADVDADADADADVSYIVFHKL